MCEAARYGEGWDGAFEYASEALKGSPAEAGPDMMKKSYRLYAGAPASRSASKTDLETRATADPEANATRVIVVA